MPTTPREVNPPSQEPMTYKLPEIMLNGRMFYYTRVGTITQLSELLLIWVTKALK